MEYEEPVPIGQLLDAHRNLNQYRWTDGRWMLEAHSTLIRAHALLETAIAAYEGGGNITHAWLTECKRLCGE